MGTHVQFDAIPFDLKSLSDTAQSLPRKDNCLSAFVVNER
jgi:hypothetical protein